MGGALSMGLALGQTVPTGIGRGPSAYCGRTCTRRYSRSTLLAPATQRLPAANSSSGHKPLAPATKRLPTASTTRRPPNGLPRLWEWCLSRSAVATRRERGQKHWQRWPMIDVPQGCNARGSCMGQCIGRTCTCGWLPYPTLPSHWSAQHTLRAQIFRRGASSQPT
jgi:hypothetical protein